MEIFTDDQRPSVRVHFAQGCRKFHAIGIGGKFEQGSQHAACLGVNVMCAFLCVFCSRHKIKGISQDKLIDFKISSGLVKKSVPSRSWINMGWRPPETTSDHQYVHFAQGCQVSRNWYLVGGLTTRQSVDAACLGVNVMCATRSSFETLYYIKRSRTLTNIKLN
ncbi:hypothetical protein TNIN_197341 [Trichonephila inaurata madagascariensis]|uniref:Uncharacterized protein n=1 Tax=Trichonephila inaurata madagascariensis TaxID=2747483 RepID=A0A8X6YAA5_9ARAC|nr:hypothetical protein TNIN_197341 [Trichonephila inaurata madagascariensis]